jgi:hypothetical protein
MTTPFLPCQNYLKTSLNLKLIKTMVEVYFLLTKKGSVFAKEKSIEQRIVGAVYFHLFALCFNDDDEVF